MRVFLGADVLSRLVKMLVLVLCIVYQIRKVASSSYIDSFGLVEGKCCGS